MINYSLPLLNKFHGRNLFSNKTIHKSKLAISWISQQKINVLEWPSRSPELNPIENVWGYLIKKVYGNGKQYQSVQDLQTAIFRAWQGMPQKFKNKPLIYTI